MMNSAKLLFVMSGVFIIVALVSFVYIFGPKIKINISQWWPFSEKNAELLKETYPIAKLSELIPGKVYLTLQANVGDMLEPTLYQIDNKIGMNRSWLDLTAVTERVNPVVGKGSSAFVAYPGPTFQSEYDLSEGVIQVMVSDIEGVIRPLTRSDTNQKLAPSWSPDGDRIAFMASTSPAAIASGMPEQWEVYITDMEGDEGFVTQGSFPQWSPDGRSLYVLKESGIVHVDLVEGSETLVYESEESNFLHAKLWMDRAGKYLLLVEPLRSEVSVFELDQKKLIRKNTINVSAASAVLSPDSTLLAVLHAPIRGIFPRLSFIRIDTGEIIETIYLEYFSNEFLLLTDWTSE